jgi:hypothetical protein
MRQARPVVAAALAVLLLASACSSSGVDRLAGQLLWASNWMNATRQSERRVEYTPETPVRYWIIALPPNSSLFQLGNIGIPQTVVAVVEDCARGGKPILALILEQHAQCVYPAYPEALNPLLVAKEAGQPTAFTLMRSDAGVRIVKME